MWHSGQQIVYSGQSADSIKWKAGDTIGVYIKLSLSATAPQETELMIGYSMNDRFLGEAFLFSSDISLFSFHPVISLEEGEAVTLNIGQHPFKFLNKLRNCNFSGYNPLFESMQEKNRRSLIEYMKFYKDFTSKSNNSDLSKEAEPTNKPIFDPIELDSPEYGNIETLSGLGLQRLKFELERRGMKAGGSLIERATRLHSVRGIPNEQIDKKLLVKN